MAKIMSLNVHGLNSNKKRHLALREFKQSGADVIMIHETNFNKGDSFTFASRHYPQIYQAFNPSKRAGIAILFKRGSPFTCSATYLDPQGHYIILCGHWQTQDVTFCVLYAPNTCQHRFLAKVLTCFSRTPCDFLVIGGDFIL